MKNDGLFFKGIWNMEGSIGFVLLFRLSFVNFDNYWNYKVRVIFFLDLIFYGVLVYGS